MPMRPLRPLAAALLLAACALPAVAQWQWVDKDGRKVFSDQPPPGGVPDKDILRRPAGARAPVAPKSEAPAATAAPAVPAAASAPAAPKPSGVDAELQERKKAAEAAEDAAKKAEEAKQAKARADNCQRARQGKATLDSGIRIAQTNAQGERVILDDAGRAAEARRVNDIIASDCK